MTPVEGSVHDDEPASRQVQHDPDLPPAPTREVVGGRSPRPPCPRLYPALAPSRRYFGVQPVAPAQHTMREHLPRYVLPKIPVAELAACRGRALVHGGTDLQLQAANAKRDGKRFNWRRPYFDAREGTLQCFTAPGRDYAYHYAHLLAAACVLIEQPAAVEVELPAPSDADAFIERWLPLGLPASEVVVLGYVQHLFTDRASAWIMEPGFGWSNARVGDQLVGLLGCEFSFWGDLAGALVSALARRGTRWVIYVGKLGALGRRCEPNNWIATGSTSWVAGETITWDAGLRCDPDVQGVLTGQRHVTVPSTLDETLAWYSTAVDHWDLVDPEIGRMATSAAAARIQFDYVHVISDSLAGHHHEGLYDERSASITAKRRICLDRIATILDRSLA